MSRSPEYDPSTTRPCARNGCLKAGLYRAPKSTTDYETYQWLCLSHIRAFNRSWDYYVDKPASVLEYDLRARYIGDNPTRRVASLSSLPLDSYAYGYRIPGQAAPGKSKEAWPNENFFVAKTQEQQNALKYLRLKSPLVPNKISERFRQIAKYLHPDKHRSASETQRLTMQEELKRASKAYAVLKKACLEMHNKAV